MPSLVSLELLASTKARGANINSILQRLTRFVSTPDTNRVRQVARARIAVILQSRLANRCLN